MKIYICGPVTGTVDADIRFADAEARLKMQYPEADVINPVSLCTRLTQAYKPKVPDWEDYMSLCFPYLLRSDNVYLLPGWERSKGCRVEIAIAHALNIKVMPDPACYEKQNGG